ncbi:peptidylprolyl isomerase [Nocardioides sp. GY 10113]|uniref:peptidylprolyl isomerase n=1 Tax=Nocardioides sp. GY 10113 TaxID=2569761 RepID=UPI0010A88333|nr:peptidylprolyl isomerase [Nocardioides sp. GY 10113]TIC87638.1 peptidylprolyl isomerase [Nocardioides sp. GY 10113]
MLTRSLAVVPAVLLVATLSACGGDDGDATASDPTTASASASDAASESTDAATTCAYTPDGSVADPQLPPAEPTVSGEVKATLETTIGDLPITLDADAAPCTVNSIVFLAESGYYDDSPCHRMTVADVFKILQCGDPTGTGTGGPGYTVPDEITGSETYGEGTLAMANTGAPDSGGSQFFICYGDTALNAAYTVFGAMDPTGTDLIADAARAGVTPEGAQDGAPKTSIQITGVSITG